MLWIPRRPLRRKPELWEALVGAGLLGIVASLSYWLTSRFYIPNFGTKSESIVYAILVGIGRLLGPWVPGETHIFLYVFLLGLLLGTVVVWGLDYYKRYQAVFLLAVVVVGLLAAIESGRLVEPLLRHPTLTNFASLGLGVLLGIQFSGADLVGALRDHGTSALGDHPREFPLAPKLVFGAFLLVFVANFFDYHFLDASAPALVRSSVREQAAVVPHFLAGTVTLTAFWKFTEYESEIRTVQVGPARAGKTAALTGLYDYLEGSDDYKIDEARAEFDPQLREQLAEGKFPSRNRVADRGGQSTRWLEIPFVSKGWLFRKRIVISTLDYPGELIGRAGPSLNEEIQEYRDSDEHVEESDTNWAEAKVFAQEAQERLPAEQTKDEVATDQKTSREEYLVAALARAIEAADTVLMTIPLDDFVQKLAGEGVLPDYVDAYWLKEDETGQVRVFDTDHGPDPIEEIAPGDEPTSLDQIPPDIDRLPEYDHDTFGSVKLYVRNEEQRAPSEEYREKYRELVDRYGVDGDAESKTFVWTVTKCDYAKKQFLKAFNKTSDVDFSGKTLAEIVGTRARWMPEKSKAQKLFARWIEARLIDDLSNWHNFGVGLRRQTGERFVYPLWYQISDDGPPDREDGEPQIETYGDKTLNGASHLVDRIERRPFVEYRSLGWLVPIFDNENRTNYVVDKMEREYSRVRADGSGSDQNGEQSEQSRTDTTDDSDNQTEP